MYPLTLCFALTAHKCQGTTNKDYCVPNFGDKETVDNGSYVMLGRAVNLDRVWIKGGVTFERFSTAIGRMKRLPFRLDEEKRLQCLSVQSIEEWVRRGGEVSNPDL